MIERLQSEGRYVVIKSDGCEIQRFPISENREVTLNGPVGKTIVKTSDETVRVLHSDCKAKICERSSPIHRAGEMIICVPNKIVILISENNKHSIDVITE